MTRYHLLFFPLYFVFTPLISRDQIKELCNHYLKCDSGVKSDFLLNLARNHATNHQESLTAAQTFFKSISVSFFLASDQVIRAFLSSFLTLHAFHPVLPSLIACFFKNVSISLLLLSCPFTVEFRYNHSFLLLHLSCFAFD